MTPALLLWHTPWKPHMTDPHFFSVDSDPVHIALFIQTGPDPSPTWASPRASTGSPQSSSLHTTAASAKSQPLSHTVPHWPLWRTSTVPLQGLFLLTNRTFIISVYRKGKKIRRDLSKLNESFLLKRSTQTCTKQSNIIFVRAVVFGCEFERCFTHINLRFISSALNLLCPHLSVSFTKSSCSQHLYRSPTVQLSTHNLCILLVKDSITHWHPRLIMKDL